MIPSLVSLYEWHNGTNTLNGKDSILEILPFGKFFNLTDMISMKNDFVRWDYLEIEGAKDYVPIFGSGEDDMYLVNEKSGIVYELNPAANIYGEPYFQSIEIMIDFIIECYQDKIFIIDPINGLDVKFDKYYSKKSKLVID